MATIYDSHTGLRVGNNTPTHGLTSAEPVQSPPMTNFNDDLRRINKGEIVHERALIQVWQNLKTQIDNIEVGEGGSAYDDTEIRELIDSNNDRDDAQDSNIGQLAIAVSDMAEDMDNLLIDEYIATVTEGATDDGVPTYTFTDQSGNETTLIAGDAQAIHFGTEGPETVTLRSRDNQTVYSVLLATQTAQDAINNFEGLSESIDNHEQEINSLTSIISSLNDRVSEIEELLTIGSDTEISQPVMTINGESPDSDGDIILSTSDLYVDD